MKKLHLCIAVAGVLAIGAALLFGAGWVEISSAVLLANGPAAFDIKAIEDVVEKARKGIKETTDRMQQALDQAINENKTLGTLTAKTAEECKAASEAAKKTEGVLAGIMERVLEVEQKVAKRLTDGAPGGRKSWGDVVSASEQFKAAAAKGGKGKPEMEAVEVGSFHKAAIVTSSSQDTTSTANMLGGTERAPFVAGTQRQLVVRSLIPVYSTESSMVEYARELLFTNSAAVQGAAASPPGDTDGQPLPESSLTFEFVQAGVKTLGHWIPASRQVLADAKMLGSYIDQRLRYGVLLEEEDQVLNGTGSGNTLNGIIAQATAYNRRNTSDNRLDTLLKAFLQVTLSDYTADGVVMSHVDWTELLLLKDDQGRYLFGDPTGMRTPGVWGRPVVPSNSADIGEFLTGAFQLGAALWDREQATVRVAEQHEDFAVRGMVAIIAEERVVLTVFRPSAFVTGNFGAAAGQPG
jgi:HK97 family phage major capsid protein